MCFLSYEVCSFALISETIRNIGTSFGILGMVTAIHSMEESMMKAKNNGSFNLTSRDQPAVINMSFLSIQSTLSKTDTFGTGTSCLS